jgi:hypothetical protein
MRAFSIKVHVYLFAITTTLFTLAQTAQAADAEPKVWKVHYRDAVFTINRSLTINLHCDPETTLQGHANIKTQWLALSYYQLVDCPIRLTVWGRDLYGVQFMFSPDDNYQLEISLYDLKIHNGTKLGDLERYFQANDIEYTKGRDNIATSFSIFYYVNHKIYLCEFRAVILRNYEDFYFKKTGEPPWWLT